MNIRVHEFKKVITSPVIIGLIVLFITFNFVLIFQHNYIGDELPIINELVNKLGYEINDEMLGNFQDYYGDKLKKMNEMTYTKTSKTYVNVGSFLEEVESNYGLYKVYTDEELDFVNQLMVIETYLSLIEDMEDKYATLDMMEFAEGQISMYGLSGSAAETVRSNYLKLGERLNQLLENGEHKNMFFIGPIYRMHSLLFENIFKMIIFQIMIIVVLITGYLMNYEFENKTPLVVYSTKRGRNIIWDKLLVSISSGMIATTLIMGITLIGYFSVFSYTGLWNVPISNYFNWESVFPLISWWNMSFLQYLISSIILTYICGILFTGITFILSIFTKSSYISFFAFGILFGLILLMPNIMPKDNNLIFVLGFTPFNLVLNPHIWFTGTDPFSIFKHYETITVGVWSLFLFITARLSARKFKREDIY
ncbi:ABC transporter permease subunit [Irregularibacter muris]|uniref:ABC transporter permease subunit n=1 Tax=Irregularibacter muris TaxID=1796619 RepID=A0AAE3HGX7_9FIRM|nr:ABC transporter permease subunit [Irregularibacter muris]MCR1899150.1 ABC transporter permease subunit [Irregularibacter muris]